MALDPETVAATLPAVRALGGGLAASGMYAPSVPVPPNASGQDQLLAALGRPPAAIGPVPPAAPTGPGQGVS